VVVTDADNVSSPPVPTALVVGPPPAPVAADDDTSTNAVGVPPQASMNRGRMCTAPRIAVEDTHHTAGSPLPTFRQTWT
jgi:hypothetical protein